MTTFSANTLASPPDPKRDIPFVPRPGIKIADSLDQIPNVFEVEDQQDVGACVSNGVLGIVESILKLAGRPRDLSRMAHYTMTLKYEGRLGQEGLVPKDGYEVLRKLGMCDEDAYPYDTSLRATDPPQAIYDLCLPLRLDRYEWVVTTADFFERQVKIDRILAAMNEGHSVGFALQVSASLRDLAGSWQTHNYAPVDATHPTIGGHYMIFRGYDRAVNMFLVQNSWGTKKKDGTPYGDGGFVGLPFNVVDSPFFEATILRSVDGAGIPEEPGIKLEVSNQYRIEARIIPRRSEINSIVSLWAGAMIEGKLYLKTSEEDTWALYDGVNMPPFKRDVELGSEVFVPVVKWTNLEPFAGAEVYVAYGATPLTWTLAKVCVVPRF